MSLPDDDLPIVTNPGREDLDYLDERLSEFNIRKTGYPFDGYVCLFQRDENGIIVAGLTGFVWGRCLRVEILWVDERLRGRGVGTRLLRRAEEEAIRRGALISTLSTHSFQAPEFYQKHGYELVGTVEGYPYGHAKLSFRKVLAESLAESSD